MTVIDDTPGSLVRTAGHVQQGDSSGETDDVRSRQKIIEATLRLIERGGFRAVSIVAVATEADVSRQTIYSIFTTRERLVSEALAEVGLELGRDLRQRVATVTDPAEALAEMIVAARTAAREHALLGLLGQADQGHPLFDEGWIQAAKVVIVQILPDHFVRDPVIATRLDDVTEVVVRLGTSVIFFDSDATRSDEDLRDFLLRWIRPALASLAPSPG